MEEITAGMERSVMTGFSKKYQGFESRHYTSFHSGCYSNKFIQVAVIGDFHRHDFQKIVRDIREKTAAIYFDNLALFFQANGLGQSYDLIFLLASGFAQYSLRDIQQVQNRTPFARIVMIAGSLAEGERRTCILPPELIRHYGHEWEIEVLPVFTSFCDRRHSAWGLPPTTSDEERLLATARTVEKKQCQSNQSPRHKAVIVADDPTMREFLEDWSTQKSIEAGEILFDVISENFAETLATVQFLKKHNPSPTRLTVFYNSPRPDEIRQLTQAGADRVVSKPFFLP